MPPPHNDDTVSLAALRELLGDENTLTLLEHYSGIRIKLPRSGKTSWLVRALGSPIAERLIKRYGTGSRLCVPLGKQFRAVAMRQQGKSYSQIAARLCITESTVYRHIAEGNRVERQSAFLKSVADASAPQHKRTKVP